MAIGILTGIAAGLGALGGGMAAWWEQKRANEEIEARNKQIKKNLESIRARRESSIARQTNTSQDFLNRYSMLRDPQKSEGIRQLYSQNRNIEIQGRDRMDQQANALRLGIGKTGGTAGAALTGALGGAIQGASFGAGLEGTKTVPTATTGTTVTKFDPTKTGVGLLGMFNKPKIAKPSFNLANLSNLQLSNTPTATKQFNISNLANMVSNDNRSVSSLEEAFPNPFDVLNPFN